ncbi:MAG: Fic family protein [Flavobacteriales bacterium]|nr:Fic family protein [Flavobacteriales bacterium]MEB2341444.1 Fic family protein [Flavobacteriia bacterium]
MEPFVPDPLPIEGLDWQGLMPIVGQANRALARYDGILMGIPSPEVLLSPLTTQEAVLSSSIEGTQATLGDVLQFDSGQEPELASRKQDIGEIINYRKALHAAERELANKPFHLNMLKRLHAILLNSVRGQDKRRGQFRTTQNFIGKPGTTIAEAYFVPPSPLVLQEHLRSWECYYHTDRPDPLVQLAIVHAQFEVLHPFDDGNGRLGRIIIPLFLFEKQLLPRPMFYMSGWLERHRGEYIARLRAIGREPDAWTAWIRFFLTGLAEQAKDNCDKARAIMDLYAELKQRALEVTRSQFAVPMLDQMFERPIFTSSLFTFQGTPPTSATVSNLLRSMRENGLVKVLREGSGRRGTVYVLARLLNLCEGREVY